MARRVEFSLQYQSMLFALAGTTRPWGGCRVNERARLISSQLSGSAPTSYPIHYFLFLSEDSVCNNTFGIRLSCLLTKIQLAYSVYSMECDIENVKQREIRCKFGNV